ncbi:MAG TPA: 30S ribosomal protein S27ae [Candidatus Woesearchaeota archaeon]|nr:30S ribosomal protein S27ae [Candidatus Woesearchaeota archaeon]
MGKKKKGGGSKKGKKKPRVTKSSAKYKKYTLESGKVVKKGKPCPKCGSGVFLAEHKDRLSCGKCHYMEVKKTAPKEEAK